MVPGCTVADRGYPPADIEMTFPDGVTVSTSTESIVHKSFRLKRTFHGESIICVAGRKPLRKETIKTLKVAFGPEAVRISGLGEFFGRDRTGVCGFLKLLFVEFMTAQFDSCT